MQIYIFFFPFVSRKGWRDRRVSAAYHYSRWKSRVGRAFIELFSYQSFAARHGLPRSRYKNNLRVGKGTPYRSQFRRGIPSSLSLSLVARAAVAFFSFQRFFAITRIRLSREKSISAFQRELRSARSPLSSKYLNSRESWFPTATMRRVHAWKRRINATLVRDSHWSR